MSAFTLVEGDVTLRSGGIETAVGDGLPLPVGTRGYIGVGFDGTNTRYIRVDGTGRTIVVGPDAPGASFTGNPITVGGVDIGGFVRQFLTDSTGRQRVVGAADNATPVTGAPVLVGGSDGTNVYRLLTDSAGRLQVTTSGGGGGTSSTFGAVFPSDGTAAGFYDGTNMQGARVFDLDSGGGTEWNLGVTLRFSGPGGSVAAGTSSNPIRVDPTGTTTQPISGTVTANQGTAAALAGAWPTKVTDGTNTMPTGDAVARALYQKLTDGTNGPVAVKPASTPAVATDPALVVAISPNSPISIGTVSLRDAAGNPIDSVPATQDPAQIYKAQVTNTGSADLRVNGSITPVNFDLNADPTDNIWVAELRFVLVVNPLLVEGNKFGPINALTNGVLIQVRSNSSTTTLGNVKITEEFLAFPSRGGTVVDRTGTNDVMTIGYYLGGIVELVAGSGDFVRVSIRDNLTSVKFKHFSCTVHGIKRP